METSSSSSTNPVTLRDLIQIIPEIYAKFKQDYESYKEIVILLYLIVSKKACVAK